ncbi:MAG TPA: NUDIX domain-containing protein [Candidatus Limnocylindrales bacterium]|nr:NUDIX domain-containing protein [Candidatus Limnocylindrales bacterium]
MPSPTDDRAADALPPPSGLSAPDELGRVTRLAAYGVIRRGEAVLLCRISPMYPAAGDWTLPGGGIEFGEAPDTAVLREVEEETGLVARITGAPAILSHTGTWPATTRRPSAIAYHHVRFVYPMEIVGGSERMEVDGSTDACGWFSPQQLTDLPLVGLASLALGLPVRAGEDEEASGSAASSGQGSYSSSSAEASSA